jgi:protein involved in polysaccharide export with SLBB domain
LVAAYKALEYDPAANEGEKEYLIQPGDVIEVRFDNQPQFNDSVVVRPDGKISLGLVKTVVAEGKTPEQLEKELTEKYARFIKTPDLVVIMRQFTGDKYFVNGKPVRPGLKNIEGLTVIVRSVAQRQVYVGGEVGAPGPIPYQYPMTAFQAILAAGGIPRTGQLSNVLVLRRLNQEEPVQFVVNLKMDKTGRATNDIPLHPNDLIYVQRTPIAKINNFLQQYFYDIFPMAKNSTFNGIYQFKFPNQAINFEPTSGDGTGQ